MTIIGFAGEIVFEDRVVAHYKDGRILKGHTRDFSPARDSFTLQPYSSDSSPVPVFLDDLKAVFHVRTFEGNPEHPPRTNSVGSISDPRYNSVMQIGRKVALEFLDGEQLWGYADSIGPDPWEHSDPSDQQPGFFFFPTDPGDNNVRMYIVRSSVKELVFLDH